MDPNLINVEISARAADRVNQGYLWIFSNELISKPSTLSLSWCRFLRNGKQIGVGYVNPHSLIAGRLVALGNPFSISEVIEKRLEQAIRRRPAFDPNEARRLVYSEADLLPGLIVDCYADVAVAQSNTAGMDLVLDSVKSILPNVYKSVTGRPLKGFVIRADASIRRLENVSNFSEIVLGEKRDVESVKFQEDRAWYSVNTMEGQKTGFFLDQRSNRKALADVLKEKPGARVLDLFCYSGGWGIRALQSGAAHVTFVDESEPALELVRQGLSLNKIETSKAELVKKDVFDFLEQDQSTYDVIVADPPAFVKSKKDLGKGGRAYEKLNRLAWRKLKEGGFLFSSSCSFHVSESDFLELVRSAVGKERGWAHVAYHGTQAPDHPSMLSMPETTYLKCLGLQKLSAS